MKMRARKVKRDRPESARQSAAADQNQTLTKRATMFETENLRSLCRPEAESLADGYRLTQLVRLGHGAADEIDRLRAALTACEAYMTACGYFASKQDLARQVRAALK